MRTTDKAYARYGGRGIRVCDRWQIFENFVADMGDRPKGMSLDRIDSDGDYAPGNCRWATAEVQSRNRRCVRHIEIEGKSRVASEYAEGLGLCRRSVVARIKNGWDPIVAATCPNLLAPIVHNGRSMGIKAWAREVGIKWQTLTWRLNHGWPVDRALNTPVVPGGTRA